MKHFHVATKLTVSFSIIALLTALIAGFNIYNVMALANAAKEKRMYITDPLDHMVRFAIAYGNVRSATRDIGRATEEAATLRHIGTMNTNMDIAIQSFRDYLDIFEGKNPNAFDPEEYEAVKTVYESLISYQNICIQKLTPAGLANDADLVFRTITVDLAYYGGPIREYVDILTTLKSQQSADWAADNQRVGMIVNFILLVVVFAVSILLSLYIAGLIGKPLTLLAAFMKQAGSTGEIAISAEDKRKMDKYLLHKDEIGQTMAATFSFLRHVTVISEQLEALADGDLTKETEVLSDKDVMGISVKHVVDNLTKMFKEIGISSTQVSVGSRQIADGSQALAQGATEQAATIADISTAISSISENTTENASLASKAADLVSTITQSAQKGATQMEEMMVAVNEINDASKNISAVIRAIDDIAFQTNLLALNAAVEAARAGQHGKGFAVVAEEVRNLAAKSAAAAQDTTKLIANSMDKAKHGAEIAEDTSASLGEIVSGIGESGQLIKEIAKASLSQNEGISRINEAVDQVAKVVQQNSATAEESAAASEELSGQSNTLEKLIEQFKLKR
ncbi:MAG: methyl-accepting chemotaxis protein [Planctomycetaceae bacterium]|nr:methyl-accepting chemotaxis protein [Planctomycetaceae bacterium]